MIKPSENDGTRESKQAQHLGRAEPLRKMEESIGHRCSIMRSVIRTVVSNHWFKCFNWG